ERRAQPGANQCGGSGFEAAESTPVEQQGLGLAADLEVEDAADDNQVVAGVVLGLYAAVDPCKCLRQHGRAGTGCRLVADAGELVATADREPAAERFLVIGEHVDAEHTGALDARVTGGRLAGEEG